MVADPRPRVSTRSGPGRVAWGLRAARSSAEAFLAVPPAARGAGSGRRVAPRVERRARPAVASWSASRQRARRQGPLRRSGCLRRHVTTRVPARRASARGDRRGLGVESKDAHPASAEWLRRERGPERVRERPRGGKPVRRVLQECAIHGPHEVAGGFAASDASEGAGRFTCAKASAMGSRSTNGGRPATISARRRAAARPPAGRPA